MRLWLPCLLALTAITLAGLSWISILYYSVFTFGTLCFVWVFLTNACELDFELAFKFIEWVGFGTPHSVEFSSKGLNSRTQTFTDGNEYQNLHQLPRPIAENLEKLITNINRDFVVSWFRDVGEGEGFVGETRKALEILSLEGYKRACDVDAHNLIEEAILIFHSHLERFNKAVDVLKARDTSLKLSLTNSQLLHQTYESQIQNKHIALKGPASELNYLRNVVDCLLAVLLPQKAYNCDMGKFILREILAVQAVELVELISDPDWVNEAIIDLLCPPKNTTVRAPQALITRPTERELDLETISSLHDNRNGEIVRSNGSRNLSMCNDDGTVDRSNGRGQVRSASLESFASNVQQSASQGYSGQKYSLGNSPSHRGYSESFVVISCSSESQGNGVTGNKSREPSFSLSSSWGVCPPAEDPSFLTESFQAMENQAQSQSKGSKLSELRTNVKHVGSCCTKLEVSDEIDSPILDIPTSGDFFHGIRSRSSSHPENISSIGIKSESSHAYTNHDRSLQRSCSVPCLLSPTCEFAPISESEQAPPSPVKFYEPQYFNVSFCSSEGSFKSFADEEELDLEEGKEIEEDMSTDDDIIDDVAPLPIVKPPKGILKQMSSESIEEKLTAGHKPSDKNLQNPNKSRIEGSLSEKRLSSEESLDSVFKPQGYVSFRGKSEGSKDSSSSENKSSFERLSSTTGVTTRKSDSTDGELSDKSGAGRSSPGFFSQKSDSESFSDSVLMAGRKFISSIKSPARTLGFSSSSARSSTASTESSSGFDSMEVNLPTSMDREPSVEDANGLPCPEPVRRFSTSSGRRLSRSNAVREMSSESDSDTWYGTPQAHSPPSEQIVYGTPMQQSQPSRNGPEKSVVKIHPSRLITIPETEIALESGWEPGRNKFTLYRIEYDIRIWPQVYKALVSGSNQQEMSLRALKKEPSDAGEKIDSKKLRASFERAIPVKRAIKRRYREFMELHSRLTSGPLAVQMKDVLKPNRKFNLPFGRLDKEVVEGRRIILQDYLVSLVSKPDLRNSMDLQQFLGVISSDVSFIKPSVAQIINQTVHVPRVDKMLGRQMTKVFDSIKTAFDSDAPESDNILSPPPDDNSSPWKLAYSKHAQGNGDHTFTPAEHFDAFLENFLAYNPVRAEPDDDFQDDQEEIEEHRLSPSPWLHSALHDDYSSDDDLMLNYLGPGSAGSAGDSSESPNDHSVTSLASSDEGLYDAFGQSSPVNTSFPMSASTGCLKEKLENSTFWDQSPPSDLGSSLASCKSDDEDANYRASLHLPFSKKNLDQKWKSASDKMKERKSKSVENVAAAKDKMKAFKGEKFTMDKLKQAAHQVQQKQKQSRESLHAVSERVKAVKDEKLKHAAEELKHIKQEATKENLQAAKERMKALKDEKLKHATQELRQLKEESAETFEGTREKMKVLTNDKLKEAAEQVKQKKHESRENLKAAKDKMKSLNVEKLKEAAKHAKQAQAESMESTIHKVKAANAEKFRQVAEQVLEKKHESEEKIHAAKEKVKVMKDEKLKHAAEQIKQRKCESAESLHAAKEKARSLKDNLPNPKIIVKEHMPHVGPTLTPLLSSRMPNKGEVYRRLHNTKADLPLAMSNSDEPSSEVQGAATDIQPGEPQCPLSEAILALTCEVLKGRGSWASLERVQQGFLGVFSGLFEWFIRREIDDLFTDDNWGVYLSNLNEIIWPDGKLREPPVQPKTDDEKDQTKKIAVKMLMEFFPELFSLAVGSQLYKECADNVVESLQNPAINRILVYLLVEAFLAEFIPELQCASL
ncbi:uncharacterized protein LOC5517514 [Nematostella vectensis]|uniref:uncharacterized protein LOC5517514 n=1 Tax=Nematostella vectensis TaxID=45351 RepID=UPI0020773776|nr:uncharacterized protein LOC5517514 [Nematostella vectensis]